MSRLTNILISLMVMRFTQREIANVMKVMSMVSSSPLPMEVFTSQYWFVNNSDASTVNVSKNIMVTKNASSSNGQCTEWRATNWSAFQSSDLWHTHSACCFSKFALDGSYDCLATSIAWPDHGVDCQHGKDTVINVDNLHLLQNDDSLYVQLHRLEYFVDKILPKLNVSIVLFSTSWDGNIWSTPKGQKDFRLRDRLAKALLSSNKIVHMFLTNPPYAYSKMSGMPLGLKLKKNMIRMGQSFTQYVDDYWKFVLSAAETDIQKGRTGVYLGHLAKTHDTRLSLPSQKSVPFTKYLTQMSKHEYVLSPRGVKPDCYRNWEAIGLGVVPVTNINHSPILRDQILLPYWLDHFQCVVQSRYSMQIKYRETAQIAKLLRQ